MKLVAQRVMQPNTRLHAIHAFYYLHGGFVWNGEPPPGLGPGTLQASQIVLRPLGRNTVLSYLDIIAPDETPTSQILRSFAHLYDGDHPPPFGLTVANCTFESNMIRAYQLAWRRELVLLYDAAIAVRRDLVA
jgi:hypothetical protein